MTHGGNINTDGIFGSKRVRVSFLFLGMRMILCLCVKISYLLAAFPWKQQRWAEGAFILSLTQKSIAAQPVQFRSQEPISADTITLVGTDSQEVVL